MSGLVEGFQAVHPVIYVGVFGIAFGTLGVDPRNAVHGIRASDQPPGLHQHFRYLLPQG